MNGNKERGIKIKFSNCSEQRSKNLQFKVSGYRRYNQKNQSYPKFE